MAYGKSRRGKSSSRSMKGGVHGSMAGRQMGAPQMGAMQTPARVAKLKGGRSMRGGRR